MRLSDENRAALLTVLYRKDPVRFFKDMTNLIPSGDQEKTLRDIADLSKSRMIICSGRGTGKTQMLSVIALWYAFVLSYFIGRRVSVIIASGSFEQSQILYNYCRDIMSKEFISNRIDGEPIKSYTKTSNGSVIKALKASEKQVRGQHGDLLIIDEAVEAGDLVKVAFQITSTSDMERIILASTPHHYFSTFVEIWDKPEDWGFLKYPAWTAAGCPWISLQKIAQAKAGMDATNFAIEYEGVPTPLTGNVFAESDIRKCRDSVQGELPPTHRPGSETYAGVDWGYHAPTVLTIVEHQNDGWRVLLAEGRKHERFEDLQDWIREKCQEYEVQELLADSEAIGENQRLQDTGTPISPISFKGEKGYMIGNLRTLLEKARIGIHKHFGDLLYQLSHYTYDAKRNDDYVDSLMLACKRIYALDKAEAWDFVSGVKSEIVSKSKGEAISDEEGDYLSGDKSSIVKRRRFSFEQERDPLSE